MFALTVAAEEVYAGLAGMGGRVTAYQSDGTLAWSSVTDGDVLQGVRYQGAPGATTESLVMRSRSGTVRRISSRHDRAKLRAITGERYG